MTDNFDLKKYLVENKVTTNSKMLKEDDTEDMLEKLRNTRDYTEFVDDDYEYLRFAVGTVKGIPYMVVDDETIFKLNVPVSKFKALFKSEPFFGSEEGDTYYYAWDQSPEVDEWVEQYQDKG